MAAMIAARFPEKVNALVGATLTDHWPASA
jgi:hypothetical protein